MNGDIMTVTAMGWRGKQRSPLRSSSSTSSSTCSTEGNLAPPGPPEQRSFTKNNGKFIKLLRNERYSFFGAFHDMVSVGVESRFTCENVEVTCRHLQERAKLIASQNPLCFGRLVKHRGAAKLWVPDEATAVKESDRFLQTVWVDGTKFEEGLPLCRVGTGNSLFNKDLPVLKLCVIRSRDDNVKDIIVTFCVTHTVGEPHTVYSIWHMLNPRQQVNGLILERVHGFRGHNLLLTSMKGPGFRKFVRWSVNGNSGPLSKHKRPVFGENTDDQVKMHCCQVNMDWVNEQKKNHDPNTPDAPYLSTHDIVCSWFFSQTEPAMIAIPFDMRGRDGTGVTQQHQGNYQDILVLLPKEYKSPANIRRAIETRGKWQPSQNKIGMKNSGRVGGITGWQGQYTDLELPDATRRYHMQLRMADGQMPPLRDPPMLVLWKTSSKDYAMRFVVRGDLKDKRAMGPELSYKN